MRHRRNRSRKQVTKIKEEPLELRRKKETRKSCLGEGVGEGVGMLPRESTLGPPS